ncbi:DUF4826 family protein [Bowmanella dokdonensis]|uniref:DUF4826 family protein n=1 Tax=Bowmanella dokdonensis TaxID=751969 RepID=A0A939ILU2_9ALTE|nr:DUF4826 family protein [Bowmanella dokdonensis]MBN7824578.1 DUF4826 family protein [Bowmanella dokdonensis]
MTEQAKNMTQEQVAEWVRAQLQKSSQFLAEKGIVVETVKMEESRYLAPWVTIWKVKSRDGKYYWAVSGDMPSDVLPLSAAKDPRAVLRHLSLNWQMKADDLQQSMPNDPTQQEFAKLLITKAHLLYDISEQDEVWKHG